MRLAGLAASRSTIAIFSPRLPFPVPVRDRLVEAGRVEPHHVLPESGWVSVRIRGQHDVPAVIELFRMNYERAWLSTSD